VFADLIGVRVAFLLAGGVVGVAAITAAVLFHGTSTVGATASEVRPGAAALSGTDQRVTSSGTTVESVAG